MNMSIHRKATNSNYITSHQSFGETCMFQSWILHKQSVELEKKYRSCTIEYTAQPMAAYLTDRIQVGFAFNIYI